MVEMVSIASPILLSVSTCGALLVPTACAGKLRLAGEMDPRPPCPPVPLSERTSVAPLVPFTVSSPVRVPVAVGVKVKVKVQVDPLATPGLLPGGRQHRATGGLSKIAADLDTADLQGRRAATGECDGLGRTGRPDS